MPREKPTTTWNEINSPNTTWTTGRTIAYLWSKAVYPWHEDFQPWLYTNEWLVTSWDEPRYLSLLEMENWLNLELEDWWLIWSENPTSPDNVIDTVWT